LLCVHILMKFLIWLLLANKFNSITFLLSWVLREVDSKRVQHFSWLIVSDCVFLCLSFFIPSFVLVTMQISFCNIICFGNVTIVSTTNLVFYVIPLVNGTMINGQTFVTLSSKMVYYHKNFFKSTFRKTLSNYKKKHNEKN
jgi:hypothetical protein